MKPATGGEATGKHLPGLPGWMGIARVDRSVEEPGRPCWVGAKATDELREDITVVRPGRESERPIDSEEAG